MLHPDHCLFLLDCTAGMEEDLAVQLEQQARQEVLVGLQAPDDAAVLVPPPPGALAPVVMGRVAAFLLQHCCYCHTRHIPAPVNSAGAELVRTPACDTPHILCGMKCALCCS